MQVRSPRGGHDNPPQYPCLENPTDRGAWQAIDRDVAKSWRRLKRLSMHTDTHVYTLECVCVCFFFFFLLEEACQIKIRKFCPMLFVFNKLLPS